MKNNDRLIGLHLRMKNTYAPLLEQARNLGINSCQFFLMLQKTNKYPRLTKADRKAFTNLKNKHFSTVYAHCSYWINPSSNNKISALASQKTFKKEVSLAKQLAIKNLVLHGGTAKGFSKELLPYQIKKEGIKTLANFLNKAAPKDITVLVENTAHGNNSICSDLQDFAYLRTLLNKEINVQFCLDTSHAFAYGYNLEATDSFVTLLEQTMGTKNIALIHLNDSVKQCGSKIDQHALPGYGKIGKTVLQKIINHPKLNHIPLIIEAPTTPHEKLLHCINEIKNW